jgi:hypothetical protein
MSTDYVEQTTALIGHVEGQELLPHAIRLLSDGDPVALEQLADDRQIIKQLGWEGT